MWEMPRTGFQGLCTRRHKSNFQHLVSKSFKHSLSLAAQPPGCPCTRLRRSESASIYTMLSLFLKMMK